MFLVVVVLSTITKRKKVFKALLMMIENSIVSQEQIFTK
jgi:hypothetical protein